MDVLKKLVVKLVIGGVVVVVLVVIVLIVFWEGKWNDLYFDIVKVLIVCYGEMWVVMCWYSDVECMVML